MASGVNPICATSREGGGVTAFRSLALIRLHYAKMSQPVQRTGNQACTSHSATSSFLRSSSVPLPSCQLSQDGSLVPRTTSLRLQGNFFVCVCYYRYGACSPGLLPAQPCNHLEKCVKSEGNERIFRGETNQKVFFYLSILSRCQMECWKL